MAKIKIILPDEQVVATGMQITFAAKCGCTDTQCLQINSVDYKLVDALGNDISGSANSWITGALITAVLDVENKKAYVLNAGCLPIVGGTVNGNFSVTGQVSFGGNMTLTKGVHYGDALPPDSEAYEGRLFLKKISEG